MPVTTQITGTVVLPDGSAPQNGFIHFTPLAWDGPADGGVKAPAARTFPLGPAGGLVDVGLVPTTASMRQMPYRVEISHYNPATLAVERTDLGLISVPEVAEGDSVSIRSLLSDPGVIPAAPDALAQVTAKALEVDADRAAAQAARTAAEAAAAIAQSGTDVSVEAFSELATRLRYSGATGAQINVTAGMYVRDRSTGAIYRVLSAGAGGADLDYTGSGGVRLAQQGPWKDSGALGVASSVADYLFTQAAAARLRLSTSILSVAQALFVSGRIRGAGNSIAATSSANEIIRALAGAKIDDVDLTASGAAVPVGVHVYGHSELRRLSVDMTGSTAAGGRHAVASKSSSVLPATTPVDAVTLHEAVLTAPNGYGVLLNETAPVQRALITSSDVYAQSDAYAFNYPYAAGQHHVLSGLMAHAGSGGTSSNSGFGYSFARVHGFVGSALYSRYSRGEALHIEDGSRFGVIAGSVLRNCQSDGFYGMETGFGNNQAEATPIVNVGFAYEYTGTGAEGPNAAGVYNVWDANGFADHWIHHAGYVGGFPVGLRLEGHGVSIAQDVVVDDATDLIMTAGRHTHFGRMFGRNADTLVRAGSNDARPVIDHVVQVEGVVPGPVFAFPTPSTTIARAVARRLTLACECIGSVIAVNTTTTVNLRDMPRRCMGTISIIMDLTRGGAAARHRLMGAYPIRFDGTTFTLSDGIRDGDANAAFASTVALQVVGGKLQLRVFSGYTAETMTVVNCIIDFDGMWIE